MWRLISGSRYDFEHREAVHAQDTMSVDPAARKSYSKRHHGTGASCIQKSSMLSVLT